MKKRRTLITSPLDWQMTDPSALLRAGAPVRPPVLPVIAERGGTQLHAPKATVIVDTREQNPFSFSRFRGWFAGIKHKALHVGDYSVAGLEDVLTVERKDLPDLIHSFTSDRAVFVKRATPLSAPLRRWWTRSSLTLPYIAESSLRYCVSSSSITRVIMAFTFAKLAIAFQSLLLACIQPAQAVPLAYNTGTSFNFRVEIAAAKSS